MATRTYPTTVIPADPSDADFEADFRTNTETLQTATKDVDTEVSNARGNLGSVNSRISGVITVDGNLAVSAPTGGFWTVDNNASGVAGASSFIVSGGNYTGTYASTRAVRIIADTTVYVHISSVSYSSGTNNTTVVIDGTIGAGTVTSIAYSSQELNNLPSQLGDTSTQGTIISAVSSAISGLTNINDFFIYDTSHDSDGGRWRFQTGELSWHQEFATSGATTYRKSKAMFPAKALLVARNDAFEIYDLDGASITLWMGFIKGSSSTENMIGPTDNFDIKTVKALNGKIVIAGTGSASAVYVLDFIRDTAFKYTTANVKETPQAILNRNITATYINTVSVQTLTHNQVNSVAMTFYKVTAIDATRNVIEPTIALASESGVDVILDTGAIISLSDVSGDDINFVDFDSSYHVIVGNETQGEINVYKYPYISDDSTPDDSYKTTTTPPIRDNPSSSDAGNKFAILQNDRLAFCSANGLSLVKRRPVNDADLTPAGESLFMNSTHNTGWMLGAIKGAWLSSTVDAVGTTVHAGAILDRSNKGNDLTHTNDGTYTTCAVVDTDADLRAYSAFTSTRYFTRVYDADLDFDANTSFCIMFWIKQTGGSAEETILDRAYSTGSLSGPLYNIVVTSAGKIQFKISDDASAYDTFLSNEVMDDGVWRHVVCVVDRADDKLRMYINGIPTTTDGTTETITITNASGTLANGNAILRLGFNVSGSNALTNGSLSNVRISGTLPASSQILDIYESERTLYRPNAQASLDGTTDSDPTSIAYDSTTKKYIISNATGTSTFKDIVRISNATTSINQDNVALDMENDILVHGGGSTAQVEIPLQRVREELTEIDGRVASAEITAAQNLTSANSQALSYSIALGG